MKWILGNPRNAGIGLLTLVLLATIVLWLVDPALDREAVRAQIGPERKNAAAGGRNDAERNAEKSTTVESEATLQETSWQNPFDAAFWKASGWKFDGKSMVCAANKPADATFRRMYEKLMLSLQYEPATMPFEIRLNEPTSATTTIVQFGAEVVVSAEIPGRATAVIDRRKLAPPADASRPARLRLVATGNRLSVAWNGRRVLFCDQPAQQSGRKLSITLVSKDSEIRISQLRFEGE